jgi:aspartate/methionine/tyrosine aminotransferase
MDRRAHDPRRRRPATPHNIILTAGSQQALDLIGKLFLTRGDTVMVARPTYLGALQAFNGYEPAYLDLPDAALRGRRHRPMAGPAIRSATSSPTSPIRPARA